MSVATEITRLQNAKTNLQKNLKLLELTPSKLELEGATSSTTVDNLKLDSLVEMFNAKKIVKYLLNKTRSAQGMFKNYAGDLNEILEYTFTSACTGFKASFEGCPAPIEIDTSKGIDFVSMYWGSSATIFPPVNTTNGEGLSHMYQKCINAIDTPVINLIKAKSLWSIFQECHKLPKVEFSNWNLLEANQGSICKDDYSLKAFVIRSFGADKEFKATNLTNCYHFDGTIDATYNPNGDKDGYIYVPSAYVDELKSATGWSLFGDRIRALEDYIIPNEDGTIDLINGVFDKEKAGL